MDTEDIIPAILPEDPVTKLIIIYPEEKQVNFGDELSPNEVKEEPKVQWDCDLQKYHTLLMFDPDAPSRRYPFLSEVNHWLIGNIKGNDLSNGDVIAEYVGSGPPKYTGCHRYFFLVFEQDDRIEFTEKRITKNSIMQRGRFSTKHFMKKYNFKRVLAWNGFKAQWDGNNRQETSRCVVQ